MTDLFRMGAELIQNNSDDATTGLDMDDIAGALSGLLGSSEGGLDLASLVSGLSSNGLGEIVGSWLGNGENKGIDVSQITDLLGSDKVSQFAEQLGISTESAQQALADALPNVIDQATTGEDSLVDDLLANIGGAQGAMNMLGKMFG